ncbi:hypothetical protein [Rhodoferax sp.]|uniref:hypothetical protein n=1 Tax=Rhodoferax sp. TaxID=50421 RepID=UPI0025FBA599|nr:hypothetical protein [Rhodoferax sp.]
MVPEITHTLTDPKTCHLSSTGKFYKKQALGIFLNPEYPTQARETANTAEEFSHETSAGTHVIH